MIILSAPINFYFIVKYHRVAAPSTFRGVAPHNFLKKIK